MTRSETSPNRRRQAVSIIDGHALLVLASLLQAGWITTRSLVAGHPIPLVHLGVTFFLLFAIMCLRDPLSPGGILRRGGILSMPVAHPLILTFFGGLTYIQAVGIRNVGQAAGAIVRAFELGPLGFLEVYSTLGWVGTQHPPLMPVLYGTVLHLPGAVLPDLRYLSLGVLLLCVWLTFRIGRRIFDSTTALLGAFLLLSFRLLPDCTLFLSNDTLLLFFFLWSIDLIFWIPRRPSSLTVVGLGVLIGLGLWTRYTMALIYPVIAVLTLVDPRYRKVWPQLAWASLISILVFLPWVGIAYRFGILDGQLSRLGILASVFIYDLVIHRSEFGVRFFPENLLLRLPSGLNVFNLPVLAWGFWDILRNRDETGRILLSWVVPVAGLLMLTLPIPRYFLPVFPACALIAARGLGSLPCVRGRYVLLAVAYGIQAVSVALQQGRVEMMPGS